MKLQRLHNKAGKTILQLPYDTSTTHVMHELKWLTIGERIYFHRAILMYKALNNLTPYYITNKFYHIRHTYSTRSAQLNKLVLPKCKLATGQRSFAFRGAKEWNELNSDLRSSPSLSVFRWNLLKFVLRNRQ